MVKLMTGFPSSLSFCMRQPYHCLLKLVCLCVIPTLFLYSGESEGFPFAIIMIFVADCKGCARSQIITNFYTTITQLDAHEIFLLKIEKEKRKAISHTV